MLLLQKQTFLNLILQLVQSIILLSMVPQSLIRPILVLVQLMELSLLVQI